VNTAPCTRDELSQRLRAAPLSRPRHVVVLLATGIVVVKPQDMLLPWAGPPHLLV